MPPAPETITSRSESESGARFVGEQFVNDDNSVHLDAYTIFSGAIGYRTRPLGVDVERRKPVQ